MNTLKKLNILHKNESDYSLACLLGKKDELINIAKDWKCPSNILDNLLKDYLNDHSEIGVSVKTALASNPNLSITSLELLSQDKVTDLVKIQALNNPNHKNQKNKIIEKIHSQSLLVLWNFFHKNNFNGENLLKQGSILAGTSIFNIIKQEMVNNNLQYYNARTDRKSHIIKDWDFFFYNEDILKEIVSFLFSNFQELPKNHPNYKLKPDVLSFSKTSHGFKIDFIDDFLIGTINNDCELIFTSNAITLKIPGNAESFQFILRVCDSPKAIIETFDFAHCMSYLNLSNGELYYSVESLYSILSKELIFKGGISPVSALFRYHKFKSRGFSSNKLQLLKIVTDINKLNLNNTSILKEQLSGYYFDSHYPEIKNLPDSETLSDAELWDFLDYLSTKDVY